MTCLLRKSALARRLAVALILMFSALAAPAAAQTYDVPGIEVDVTAETAAVARDQALAEGEAKAFTALLSQFVDADAADALAGTDAETIRSLIQDFSISSEKSSSVRYLATLDYRFDADAVQAFLRERGARITAPPSEPVAVVPVWEAQGRTMLWDDPNPWRNAWDLRNPGTAGVPTVVPAGDLGDIATLSVEQAASGYGEALTELAHRYRSSGTLVTYARLVADTRTDTSLVVVESARYGNDGNRQWTADLTVRSKEGEDLDALLARAAGEVSNQLTRRWRQSATVNTGEVAELAVQVPISSLRDWVDVRSRLDSVAAVREFDMLSISRDAVRLKLVYMGGLNALQEALAATGITLEQGAYGWVLMPPDRGGDQPAPLPGPGRAAPAGGRSG